MVTVCSVCHRRLNVHQQPYGDPLSLEEQRELQVSHGLCIPCFREEEKQVQAYKERRNTQ